MKTTFYAIALGAGLLLASSLGASAQGLGVFDTERDCGTDVQTLCGGVKPGHGRIMACLQAHVGELSVGCSTILSKAIWVSRECAADIHQFCPNATFGDLGDCMRPHLGEVSGTCESAIAYIASPTGDRY
jgi:Cysteine rich repeat